jgi:hypothetical protein
MSSKFTLAVLLSVLTATTFQYIAEAQIYGDNNCGDGYYCGGFTPSCTSEENDAAYEAFSGYIGNIGDSTDSYSLSMQYTTGDGNGADIPPFTFVWHGPTLVPIAGTYVGRNALAQFFGLVNDPVNGVVDFTFNTLFARYSGGVLVPAYNCQFLIAQWQEMYSVVSTGKALTYGSNTIVYTFLNSSYPKIARADVWVDGGQYQNSFCPGQINCNDYQTIVVENCSADEVSSIVSESLTESLTSDTSSASPLVIATLFFVVLNAVFLGVLVAMRCFPRKRPLAAADQDVEIEMNHRD